MKRTIPLFITCRRQGCEGIREVRCPAEQRRGGYCSARCNAIDNKNIAKADHAAAGRKAASHHRQKLLKRLRGLSKIEAFRLGYDRGLQSKWRQYRKWCARQGAA